MNNKKIINKYTIISTLFFIIFLFIIKDILVYKTACYDKWAYETLSYNLRINEMTLIMRIMTDFGSFLFITSMFIILFLLYKNRKTIYYILINTVTILLINDFLKHIIHRPRPNFSLVKEANYSFPSSHSMVSTVFYGLLIYLIYKEVKNKKIKILLIAILASILFLICFSRIYLGAHYLSDVVGGISLGIIYLMIFLSIYKDFEKKV